jgi:hypothetical protein
VDHRRGLYQVQVRWGEGKPALRRVERLGVAAEPEQGPRDPHRWSIVAKGWPISMPPTRCVQDKNLPYTQTQERGQLFHPKPRWPDVSGTVLGNES